MIKMLRHASLILLCLALVAGTMSMAVARGQASAMSQGGTVIVICTGYGVTSITLDDQGNPVGPVHLCPDCLAGLAAYLPPSPHDLIAIAGPAGQAVLIGNITQPRATEVLVAQARGPPLVG
jgi:Kef-type K+ transport system membrane component KefB